MKARFLNSLMLAATAFFGTLLMLPSALATTLPEPVTHYIQSQDNKASIRFDGVVSLSNGEVYLPVFPQDPELPKNPTTLPSVSLNTRPDLITFDNGFFLIRVVRTQSGKMALAKIDPYPIRLKEGLLPQDLVLPEALYIPNELKIILGDLPYKNEIPGDLKPTSSPTKETSLVLPIAPSATPITENSVPTTVPSSTPTSILSPALTPKITALSPQESFTEIPKPILSGNLFNQAAGQTITPANTLPLEQSPSTSSTISSSNTASETVIFIADKTHYQLRSYTLTNTQGQPKLEPKESIALGCLPLTVHQDTNGHLFVPCINRPEVVTIDPHTNGITSRIRLDAPIRESLLISDARRLVMTHRNQTAANAFISMIDLDTRQHTGTLSLNIVGGTLAWDKPNQTLWVAHPTATTIQAIPLAAGPNPPIKTLTGLANMSALAVEHAMDNNQQPLHRLWVASRTLNQVVALQPLSGSILKTIPVGNKPLALQMGSSSSQPNSTPTLWVLCAGDDSIQAINTLSGEPKPIAQAPIGSFPTSLLAAGPLSNTVALIPAGQDGLLLWDTATGAIMNPLGIDGRVGGVAWSQLVKTPIANTVAQKNSTTHKATLK